MPSPTYVLSELAEKLLTQGKDRLPHRFDKRTLGKLARYGLLTYPDGTFSLSNGAMDEAVSWWRHLLVDKHLTDPTVRARFEDLIKRGQRWQEPPEQIAEMRFADLTHQQYAQLWEFVVRSESPAYRDDPTMTKAARGLYTALIKRGYLTGELKGQTLVLTVTPKGKALVLELGSPNPNHRQATESYDYRMVAASISRERLHALRTLAEADRGTWTITMTGRLVQHASALEKLGLVRFVQRVTRRGGLDGQDCHVTPNGPTGIERQRHVASAP